MKIKNNLWVLIMGLNFLLPLEAKSQAYDSLKTVNVAEILMEDGFNLDGYIIGRPVEIQIDHNDSYVVLNPTLLAEKQYNEDFMDYPLFVGFRENNEENNGLKDFIESYGGIALIMDDNNISPEVYADSIKGMVKKIATSIDKEDKNNLEEMLYTLDNPYPNPSNGILNIGYEIKSRSTIKLGLYDLLGREVKSFGEESSLGKYSKTIDTSDLPSGTYFLRMVVDMKEERDKSMLIKKISIIK